MDQIYIGCGGWQYFKSSGDPLINYSRVFNFVEVNTTFYQIPNKKTCKSWKDKVKNNHDFIFSVKCNQDLTHKYKLKPIEASFDLFNKMKNICESLNSSILVFQTPKDLQLKLKTINEIDNFFSVIDTKELQFVWELRGNEWKKNDILSKVENLLEKYNITHCVDYSKESPIYNNSELGYTRIFGLGAGNKYQFDDSEIEQLNLKFNQSTQQNKRVIVSFHTQRMVHDAARAKEYNETGNLIGVSGKTGIKSFLDALNEYEKYPISKNELIMDHGWKIYDQTNDSRQRMSKILMKIDNKNYNNRTELIKELKEVIK